MAVILGDTHIMYKILIMLALLSYTNQAAATKVNIVSDVLQINDQTEMDMGLKIFYSLLTQIRADMDLSIDYIPASRLREWRELESQPNVCLYNKVKSPAREQFAHFTNKPIVAFPPLRLVTHADTQLPNSIDLTRALLKHRLKIGLVEGRSYGKQLDKFIFANQGLFVWLSGEEGAKRLRSMFMKKKLDAVIEYSGTFQADPEVDISKLKIIKINESNQTVFGYIACAKSELGRQLIDKFDELLSQRSIQKDIVELHYATFFGNEKQFVSDAIAEALKVFNN